jgi:hypothetical protein
MSKSHKFSIRLLLDPTWIEPLNNIAKTHMISRLSLLRKYIRRSMLDDLKEIQEGLDKLKSIEATSRELSQHLKKHKKNSISSLNEPIEF